MINRVLLKLSNNNPDLSISDPVRFEFENDKKRMDRFFEEHGYSIISIDVNSKRSYKNSNKSIYFLGNDFFENFFPDQIYSSNNKADNTIQAYISEAHDRIIMSLRCMKDLVQEIGDHLYINPYTIRLKLLFELLGYKVISKEIISEGGLFLRGEPPDGTPFLIVSHDFIDHFMNLGLPILQSPKNIGTDPLDSHIDTYLGIINFREKIEIEGSDFNGILYIHNESLKNIRKETQKEEKWNSLKNEMEMRGYFIKEYIPETTAQKIGINFKFNIEQHNLLTNAFPHKERTFLNRLGIIVLAPEYSYSTNDCFSGGINCSYIFIPNNIKIKKCVIDWIVDQKP